MINTIGIINTLLAFHVAVAAAAAAAAVTPSSVEAKKQQKEQKTSLRKASKENRRREQEQLAGFSGAGCLDFPLNGDNFANGLSMLKVGDGSSPLCGASNELTAQTYLASAEDTSDSIILPTKDESDINCADVPAATLISMIQLSVMNPAFDIIRNCLNEQEAPHAILRMPPKGGPVTELATKDGLQELVMKHTECDGDLDSCIIPETFRITDSLQDCQIFFYQLDSGTFRDREWTIKPTNGYAGQGIIKVTDFDAQLIEPYGACDQIGTHSTSVVVQRVITPWLVDGHSCHIRTYFAFKFPSYPKSGVSGEDLYDPDNYDDPPQAWHVDAGNVHICTQPWSSIDDQDIGDYAFTCNKPWYVRSQNDLDWTQWAFPFPEHFLNTFNPNLFQQMMESITGMFQKLAIVFSRHAADTGTFSNPNEDAWSIVGVDVIVGREDGKIRPWLIDINTCPKKPFQFDSQHLSDEWNPNVSIMRVIGSKLKRKQGDLSADENDCEHNKMTALVHRVKISP